MSIYKTDSSNEYICYQLRKCFSIKDGVHNVVKIEACDSVVDMRDFFNDSCFGKSDNEFTDSLLEIFKMQINSAVALNSVESNAISERREPWKRM